MGNKRGFFFLGGVGRFPVWIIWSSLVGGGLLIVLIRAYTVLVDGYGVIHLMVILIA